MLIGSLSIKLFIRNAGSLKDKRQVLRSLKDRIRNKFNVAIAEVDHQDIWQTAVIGIVTVGNNSRFLSSVLSDIINFIRLERRTELSDYDQEIL